MKGVFALTGKQGPLGSQLFALFVRHTKSPSQISNSEWRNRGSMSIRALSVLGYLRIRRKNAGCPMVSVHSWHLLMRSKLLHLPMNFTDGSQQSIVFESILAESAASSSGQSVELIWDDLIL